MSENQKDIRLTDFDYQFADPRLQMVKAAIPYLSSQQQRFFSLLVRLQETRHTMEMFAESNLSAMGFGSDQPRSSSPLEILQAIKPYAGPKEREMIDMMENIQLMAQAMQTTV